MKRLLMITGTAIAIGLGGPVGAMPTDVWHENLPEQDFLWVPDVVDELGIGGPGTPIPEFPPDEKIDATWTFTNQTACPDPPGDNPDTPNVLVTMMNQTGRDFRAVWYVADPETYFSNYDGIVNDCLAFRIDRQGVNRPLVAESFAFDGIFRAGEIWEFIVQDYQNTMGLGPVTFHSFGVGSMSGGDNFSSASVIVPEPATMSLLAVGGLAALARRRRR